MANQSVPPGPGRPIRTSKMSSSTRLSSLPRASSKVAIPPFGLFAKMSFPPCTFAEEPTYATVQIGRNKHLNLNSDLLYINHSCEPSLVSNSHQSAV